MRLIDADALRYDMCVSHCSAYEICGTQCRTIRIINEQPTIEAEVKPKLSEDERKASEAWCENCDHIEMCKWDPFGGCEFRQIGGKPAGRAEPPESEATQNDR